MSTAILLIFLIGSIVLGVLALLFSAGFLFRCDRERIRVAGFSTPQRTRDPLALKDVLVGFFAHSKGASRIVRLLAARHKPVAYQALLDDIRFDEQWRRDNDELPGHAIPAVLGTMLVAGIVRITQHGIAITEVGREVHRRIARVLSPQTPVVRPSTENGSRVITTLSSADRTMLRVLRKNSHSRIYQ